MRSNIQAPSSSKTYTLVVGVDFETTGDNALREAVLQADARSDATIHIVHVISEARRARGRSGLDDISDRLEAMPKQLRTYIEAKKLELPSLERHTISLHTRVGSPAEAIVQLAVDVDAQLIVVGTHGRRGVKKLALGSVASRLVEIARCPVLIARPIDYTGIAASPSPEPICPDCATARAESDGETLWCEHHRRRHVRPHVFSYTEVFAVGGHDPGIVAG